MKFYKSKKFYASVLIDFAFLAVLYLFLSFIIKKIKNYAIVLQEFSGGLSNIEAVLQKNISMMDYSLLLNNVEAISQVAQKLLLLFFSLLIGGFLLYCLFQGVQWSFILKQKFKKYIGKFSLVSLFGFSLSLLFLYYILINARNIFVNYLSALPIYGLVVKICFLVILVLVLWYYTGICYILLNKYNLIKTLKKTFLFKNLKSIFVYLICFALIIFILTLNWFWIIKVILILFVINYYRYYLVRILS